MTRTFAPLTGAHAASRRLRSFGYPRVLGQADDVLANRKRDNLHRKLTANDRAPRLVTPPPADVLAEALRQDLVLNRRAPVSRNVRTTTQPPVPTWFRIYLIAAFILSALIWVVR